MGLTISPASWTASATSGSGWTFASTPGFYAAQNGRTSGTFAWIDFSGTDVGAKLETPEVCVGAASTIQMTFDFWSACGYPQYYTNSVYDIQPKNILYVEQYNGTTWSQIQMYQEGNSGWVNKTVMLSPYTNACSIKSNLIKSFSIFTGEILSPPGVIIISFFLSVILR